MLYNRKKLKTYDFVTWKISSGDIGRFRHFGNVDFLLLAFHAYPRCEANKQMRVRYDTRHKKHDNIISHRMCPA